jgi:tetratricopeptide (TPR) repeat protein
MFLAILLLAASAAADARSSSERTRKILLAVNEEAGAAAAGADSQPQSGANAKIEHTPVEKNPRNEAILIQANVRDPSRLFAPLVFARKSGTARYEAFSMRDRGPRRGFQARLPPSMLSEGSFEYFIEAQHEQGTASRVASPRDPLICIAFDPPPQPVALTIRTEEPGAAVRIDDNEAGKTPLTVRLLPGRHAVAIAAADGRSTEQLIDVKPARRMDLSVELPRQAGGPATLAVQSDPPEANLLVDGALVGRTPYQGTLQPGEHSVAVELAGHQRQERKVVSREGRDATVSFALAPLPKQPALAVDSEPVGAIVLLDGKERGRTPLIAVVSPGRHQLVLQKEGRREVSTEFDMPKDQDLSIRLDLSLADRSGSRLTVSSAPSGIIVSLNGADVGITPWSGEARPGNHKVAVSAPGFVREERTVNVQANRDTALAFDLHRAPGAARLHVETEPPALVRVGGRELGKSPLTAEVQPGEHQLEVSLEGYKTVAQQVTLDAGQGLSVRIPLQKAQTQEPPLIAISSDPAGAQIFLDQKLVGATPLKVRTTSGPHEVRLVLDGYVPRVTRPNLPPDRDFELRIAVVLTPMRGAEQKQRAPTPGELFEAQIAAAHACSLKGDLECALSGYRTAYEYRAHPRVLFNIAQVRRKLGRFEDAAATYRDFLGQAEKQRAGATQKELIGEAKRQLANCENRLMPSLAAAPAAAPSAAPAEIEDTAAPRLAHEPFRTARRSRPLRLVAIISDDRSGVGSAQACWRNAYGRDFECYPMGNTGGDEYGIEVPARAITDGFAYYLEAWDNSDNGPTRSGAPEMPHAVTLDDPPPAVVSPTAEVAVANPPSGESRFASYPFPPLLPAEPLRPNPPFEPPYGRRGAPWNVTVLLGGERSHEQSYTDSVLLGRIGVEGTLRFAENWLTAIGADWRSSRQQYAPFNGPPSARVTVDENRFDFSAAAGYDLGALLAAGGRLELTPLAGVQFLTARNTGFPFDLLGPSAGLRASWSLPPFTLRAVGAYTYNLNKDSSGPNAFLSPVAALAFRGGLEFRLNPAYAVEIDYVADAIEFEHVWRIGHGAVLGFSKSF